MGDVRVGVPSDPRSTVGVVIDAGVKTLDLVAPAGINVNGVALSGAYVPVPEAWIAPTLINSWNNLGSGNQTARYRMSGTDVEVQGVLNGGASGAPAFVLPVGFRPPLSLLMAAVANGADGSVIIGADGNVIPVDKTGSGVNIYVAIVVRFSTL